MAVQLAGMPMLYRYYIYWSLLKPAVKKFFPALYAQVITGSYLAILKMARPNLYVQTVAMRLQQLLLKQAQLRSADGASGLQITKESADAIEMRLKGDPVMLDALGSTPALCIWHHLEKMRLDSPELEKKVKPGSQSHWVLQGLREGGYLDDLTDALRDTELTNAESKAALALQQLREAVDAATPAVRYGLAIGSSPVVAKVEAASAEASEAMSALRDAQVRAGPQKENRNQSVQIKVQELSVTHAAEPTVMAELNRLKDATNQ